MSEEVRTITVKGIELREDQGDGTRIEGIAVPFGQRIGLWRGRGVRAGLRFRRHDTHQVEP